MNRTLSLEQRAANCAATQEVDLNTVPTRPYCEDKGPLHYDWTPIQPVQNTVPWPEPYATLDNENSYTKNK